MTTTAMAHVQCNMIVLRFALVMLLCFSCLFAGVGSQNLSSRDMAGLQAIWEAWKNNTLNPAENLPNWGNFSSNPCDEVSGWHGVHCANFSTGAGRKNESTIVKLDLMITKGLSGPIPKEIGQLSNLTALDLSFNSGLFGLIPKEIGQLRNLQVLDLLGCKFTGQLPDISNLTNLKVLDLGNNHFTGHLPDVSKLTNLMELSLSASAFTGKVPDLSSLTNMVILDLSGNDFTGQVPDISNLTNLKVLHLGSNYFTGHLPDVSKLANLMDLSLGASAFTGNVPDLSSLTNIKFLDLSGNNFTCQVPDISNLINLKVLYLGSNRFTGHLRDVSKLTNLMELDLSTNNFTGQVPDISNLINLQTLDLGNNHFTGHLPDVSKLTNLMELDLSANNFTGQVPDISNLTYLKVLHLGNNYFTGHLPNVSKLTNLMELDLSGNNFTGQVPDISNMINLKVLHLGSNHFTGHLPDVSKLANLMDLSLSASAFTSNVPDLSTLTNIKFLDLSKGDFTGQLPDISYLTNLQSLNLSSNRIETWNSSNEFLSFTSKFPLNVSVLDLSKLGINRPVPDQWSSVQLSQLSELYLDENNLTGVLNISAFVGTDISRSLKVLSLKNNTITNVLTNDDYILAGVTNMLLQGNPYCKNVWSTLVEASRCHVYCKPETCIFEPKSNNSSKENLVMATTISITGSVVVLMMVILGFVVILRRNRKYIRALQKKIKEADINARRFEYDELRAATRNFAPEMKLGSGAFGAVYKGTLSNDVVVAVKQLYLKTDEGRDDFVNEVLLIANLQHRNLVSLKGYCLHGKQTLLVYEYVDNCDLDKILLSRQNSADSCYAATASGDVPVLNWQARLGICQGVAQGLYYLHASSQSRIIHRDIKASNILLDKNLQPKIADFGLARPVEDAQSVVVTLKCVGTPGYLAPEYMFRGQLSDKADVFSFGVLLLEIVSGKRNRDLSMPDDEVYLPSRALKLHQNNRILDLKDPSVVVSEDEAEEVRRVLETAMLCVQNAPKKRPSMFLVAAMLAGCSDVDVAPVDECDNWPLDEYDSEFGPLFSSSSLSGPAPPRGRGRLISSDAVIELSTLQKSKTSMENARHGYTV